MLWCCAVVACTALAPHATAGPIHADKNNTPTVAVFPFKVLNKEERYVHLGEGASEAIINKLVNDKSLRTVEESQLDKAVSAIARNQSGLFEEESYLQVGQMVDARYVVIGSAQVMQEEIAISARVLEVESRQLLASERVFGPLAQTFSLYDELAAKLMSKLTYHLAQRVVGGETADEVAVRQLIDEAKAFDPLYAVVDGTAKDFARALATYDKAALRDPKNAVAQLALGHAQSRRAADLQARDPSAGQRFLESAKDHLKRATEVDAQNVFAWTELGKVQGRLGKHADARVAFNKALDIDPNFVGARFGLAYALFSTGKLADARIEASRAQDLGDGRAASLLAQIDDLVAAKTTKRNVER